MRSISAQLVGCNQPLVLQEVELPQLKPREVAVRARYAGINFYELMLMGGIYPILPPLPITPGGELAGEVTAVGARITEFQKGDRVFSLAQTGKGTTGSYAEIAHVDERYLYHLPKTLSFSMGASFPMVGFAAYTMLTMRVHIPPKGTVLIYSAAGGVGSTLVQLIKALFPHVTIIGTCSEKRKASTIGKLGADEMVITGESSFVDRMRHLCPDGFDVIFDPVGQKYFDGNLSLLRPLTGTLCSYGTYTGAVTDANVVAKLRKNNLTLSGFLMWPLIEDKRFCQKVFIRLFKLIETKKLVPLIDQIFSLREVHKAIAHIRKRENIGKVLLRP